MFLVANRKRSQMKCGSVRCLYYRYQWSLLNGTCSSGGVRQCWMGSGSLQLLPQCHQHWVNATGSQRGPDYRARSLLVSPLPSGQALCAAWAGSFSAHHPGHAQSQHRGFPGQQEQSSELNPHLLLSHGLFGLWKSLPF